jgi:hypothetical protein
MRQENGKCDQMSLRKIAQNVAKLIFVQIYVQLLPLIWAISVSNFHKTAQSKQRHIRRKFAQSGHPENG